MLLTALDERYGDTERGRQLRQRVKDTANRYFDNIRNAIGGDVAGIYFDPAFGRKSYQQVSRRVYMGLSNG